MTLVLSRLRQTQRGAGFDVCVDIGRGGERRTLSMHRTGNHPRLGEWQPKFDPFLVALMMPAMMRGLPVVIEGSIDARLLRSMQGAVQDTLRTLNADWKHVPIEAEPREAASKPDPSLGVATGMSCGIDSLFTWNALDRPESGGNRRPRLLFHNDVGAHPDRALFERHLAHAGRFADEAGIPLVSVSFDMTEWYGKRFVHSHTMRNVAAAMTLDHLFQSFVYSSSEERGRAPKLGRMSGIATLDPVLLPLFDTAATQWLSFGAHATRLEKTAEVMPTDLARRYLTVCIRDPRDSRGRLNCGRCFKCARALAYAEAEGMLDAFGDIFDVAAYRRYRGHAMLRFLRNSIGDRRSLDDLEMLAWLDRKSCPLPFWMKPFLPLLRRRAAASGGRAGASPDVSP